MALTAGIIGLPNVGKSTLFNAITNSKVLVENYPFATIDPNVGVVEVPDKRMDDLVRIAKPQKIIPAAFEFTDIAGLVKGASQGEGLGNKFLSHIREVDALCHVVRCFEDVNVTHVDGSVNPVRDVETISLELIFADLEIIEKRIPKIEKKALMKTDKDHVREYEILVKIKATLEQGLPARLTSLTVEDKEYIKNFNFLTIKPIIYIANISEEEFVDGIENDLVKSLKELATKEGNNVVVISAKIEAELAVLEDDEKAMFLEEMGVSESGLDHLIVMAYQTLGLKTYFTMGEKEVRAWTYKDGFTAPQCAGVIHSDFERGFIRAEVVSYADLMTYGSEKAAKEAGKFRLEGKTYLMQDGDICHFRFNV